MNPVAAPPALDALRAQEAEMIEVRRAIHAQPELAYEEHVTSALVAGKRSINRVLAPCAGC